MDKRSECNGVKWTKKIEKKRFHIDDLLLPFVLKCINRPSEQHQTVKGIYLVRFCHSVDIQIHCQQVVYFDSVTFAVMTFFVVDHINMDSMPIMRIHRIHCLHQLQKKFIAFFISKICNIFATVRNILHLQKFFHYEVFVTIECCLKFPFYRIDLLNLHLYLHL